MPRWSFRRQRRAVGGGVDGRAAVRQGEVGDAASRAGGQTRIGGAGSGAAMLSIACARLNDVVLEDRKAVVDGVALVEAGIAPDDTVAQMPP